MEEDRTVFAPRSRLVWSLFGSALFALAGAFSVGFSYLFLGGFALFLIAALVDLALLLQGGLRLELDTREVALKLLRGKEGELRLKYRPIVARGGRTVALGFRLPEGFCFRDVNLSLGSGDNRWREKGVTLVGMKRGRSALRSVYLRDRSALGLWQARRGLEVSWDFSVYPHLQVEEKAAASFLMRKDLAGASSRRILGKGREFDRLRSYQPGDAYADICWKASARRRAPITKVMQLERTQQVYALLDCSRLSKRVVDTIRIGDDGVEDRLQDEGLEERVWPMEALDRFVNGALSLAMATESQGDRFGLIGFSRNPRLFLKAGQGSGHFLTARQALLDLEADPGNPDFVELFSQVRIKIRSRSLLVVFTHFDDPSLVDRFLEASKLVARQHLVVAVSILSGEARPLFSEEEIRDYPELYERLTGHVVWRNTGEIGKRMAPFGIRMLTTNQSSMCSQVVSRYLQIKERQLV